MLLDPSDPDETLLSALCSTVTTVFSVLLEVNTEWLDEDFTIFFTGGVEVVEIWVAGSSSFPRELTLPKLDRDADLLGGLDVVEEGLVGSFALNCVLGSLGNVLKSGDEG